MLWLVLAFLAVFAVLVLVRADARESAAAEAWPPEGRVIQVEGVPVHVWISGSGPDLVMIHGASGNLRDFTFDFAERLTDRYRVILMDRPGLGWTGRQRDFQGAWNTAAESPYQQAALLQKAADTVGVERPIVLGHSFGGAVALAWALSRPDETAALVAVSGVSNPWPGGLGAFYAINSSALGGGLVVPMLTAFVPETVVRKNVAAIFAPQDAPEGYVEHIGPDLTLRRQSMRANAQQVNNLRPHIVTMSNRYGRLKLPVEIVHGDADTIVPLEIHSIPLARKVPGANLTVLEGVGHMPHHVMPEAVTEAIDRAATRAGLRRPD